MSRELRLPKPGSLRTLQAVRWCIRIAIAVALVRVPLAAQEQPVDGSAAPTGSEAEAPSTQEYGGPAILSRSNQPTTGKGSANSGIQPFLSVSGVYDTGLGALSGGAPGRTSAVNGMEAGFGLTGIHRWRRMNVSVQYEGNYRRYSQNLLTNGLDQFLSLTAVSPLKRHLLLSIRQTVGTVTQGMSSFVLQPEGIDNSYANPSRDPFNNREKFFDSIATISYQKSRRLVFSGSVQGSVIRREALPLIGTNSIGVSGDVSYRLSRRTTIGLGYLFNEFSFTTFGGANIHSLAAQYSWRMTRTVEVAFQGGVAHGNVSGLAVLPVDPRVAPILGTATGLQVSNQFLNTPTGGGRITKHWRRASGSFSYDRGISPGNGLVLTSVTEAVAGQFAYSTRHGWAFSVTGGRTAMGAIGPMATAYTGYTAGISVTRPIRPGLQGFTRFEARPFNYVGIGLHGQTLYRAVVGFAFSPGEVPIGLR